MSIGTTTIIRRTFDELDAETLRELRGVSVRRKYPPKTHLCRQGEIEHTFYIIVEGHVAISQRAEDGSSERLLGILRENEYFGEMGLVDNSPRIADCITVTDTTVLEVDEEAFDRFVEQSPSLAQMITKRILETARKRDQLFINELKYKNEELEEAYNELKDAQAQLIQQERIRHELELAANVQSSLLPDTLPELPDYHFASYLNAAREVGGDFYDVYLLDESHIGVLIADVADKGLHSAMVMAVLRTLFVQESQRSLSPAAVALAVHRALFKVMSTSDTFVTVFYGVLHRETGQMKYIRASHERPLLTHPDGFVEQLPGNGRFLGMIEELTLEEYDLLIQPGNRLVMYSDGVTDAENKLRENYGVGRLQTAVSQAANSSPAQIIRQIRQDVAQFCGTVDLFDDFTLLVLEAVS